ncbi:MAG: hypothetical protein KatS3mg031_0813 [Chitinophagales bacterium]|nr:MAG: hypothetical protein KatS3mg031_0813 [Chitinophagales bacterium]
MKTITIKSFTMLTVVLSAHLVSAQSTWENIYQVLHTKCSSSSCHGSGNPINSFNVDAPMATLYGQLINGTPRNPYAKDSVGHKLIVPFAPVQSYLLRKVMRCAGNTPMALKDPFEGADMPDGQPSLPDSTLRLLFSWVLAGAPDTGVIAVNDSISICDFGVSTEDLLTFGSELSVSPNPFAHTFKVDFFMENTGHARLELFDVHGKKVASLMESVVASGRHSVVLPVDLHAGVYLLRLSAGEALVVTRKVVKL